MRGPMRSSALRLLLGTALVVLLALALVREPASGSDAGPHDRDRDVGELILPSPLPSIEVPVPSVPLPLPLVSMDLRSIDLDSPLPSVSLPLPSVPMPSVSLPVPSVPLPSVPLPSSSDGSTARPTPGVSGTTPTPTAAAESLGSFVSPPGASTSASPGETERSVQGAGAGSDGLPPSGAGRIGPLAASSSELPAWLVPSLAFGVPLLLLVGAVLAQLAGGAAVLGVARRMLSRFPGPTPRWMRGPSDVADGA